MQGMHCCRTAKGSPISVNKARYFRYVMLFQLLLINVHVSTSSIIVMPFFNVARASFYTLRAIGLQFPQSNYRTLRRCDLVSPFEGCHSYTSSRRCFSSHSRHQPRKSYSLKNFDNIGPENRTRLRLSRIRGDTYAPQEYLDGSKTSRLTDGDRVLLAQLWKHYQSFPASMRSQHQSLDPDAYRPRGAYFAGGFSQKGVDLDFTITLLNELVEHAEREEILEEKPTEFCVVAGMGLIDSAVRLFTIWRAFSGIFPSQVKGRFTRLIRSQIHRPLFKAVVVVSSLIWVAYGWAVS